MKDHCQWLDTTANDLARKTGRQDPFPGVDPPPLDNGERQGNDYAKEQVSAPALSIGFLITTLLRLNEGRSQDGKPLIGKTIDRLGVRARNAKNDESPVSVRDVSNGDSISNVNLPLHTLYYFRSQL